MGWEQRITTISLVAIVILVTVQTFGVFGVHDGEAFRDWLDKWQNLIAALTGSLLAVFGIGYQVRSLQRIEDKRLSAAHEAEQSRMLASIAFDVREMHKAAIDFVAMATAIDERGACSHAPQLIKSYCRLDRPRYIETWLPQVGVLGRAIDNNLLQLWPVYLRFEENYNEIVKASEHLSSPGRQGPRPDKWDVVSARWVIQWSHMFLFMVSAFHPERFNAPKRVADLVEESTIEAREYIVEVIG